MDLDFEAPLRRDVTPRAEPHRCRRCGAIDRFEPVVEDTSAVRVFERRRLHAPKDHVYEAGSVRALCPNGPELESPPEPGDCLPAGDLDLRSGSVCTTCAHLALTGRYPSPKWRRW